MMPCDVRFGKFLCFYFIAAQVLGTAVSLFKHTDSAISFSESLTSMPGATERSLGGVCVYQLLLLLSPPTYICFHDTELSCCIKFIGVFGVFSHHVFKIGVIHSPDPIWFKCHNCRPLLNVA